MSLAVAAVENWDSRLESAGTAAACAAVRLTLMLAALFT